MMAELKAELLILPLASGFMSTDSTWKELAGISLANIWRNLTPKTYSISFHCCLCLLNRSLELLKLGLAWALKPNKMISHLKNHHIPALSTNIQREMTGI